MNNYRPQGKLMFLHLFHSVHKGGGSASEGGSTSGGCLPLKGWSASRVVWPTARYSHLVVTTAAVCMHPTGMHSCYKIKTEKETRHKQNSILKVLLVSWFCITTNARFNARRLQDFLISFFFSNAIFLVFFSFDLIWFHRIGSTTSQISKFLFFQKIKMNTGLAIFSWGGLLLQEILDLLRFTSFLYLYLAKYLHKPSKFLNHTESSIVTNRIQTKQSK